MTREEAIQWLTSLKPFDHGKYEEAINIAIGALKLCDIITDCTECPRYGDDCDGRAEEDG